MLERDWSRERYPFGPSSELTIAERTVLAADLYATVNVDEGAQELDP